ncbi:MAG: hypothetical protein PHN99_05630 [Eubacteriales bacterium]|jgi:vacuolar-type H+-ATPase subunit H|nr:hypothetical protein [Eubacteriales bacterium]MDD4717577.1 hypothetical protein [Eubacteriales bacterium]
MSEISFLDSILETEGVAGEMIFNAKAARKDRIDKAKEQADDIRINARSQVAKRHKKAIDDAMNDAKVIRESIIADADKEARKLREDSGPLIKQAAEKTAEGIVSIFGDR